MKAFQFGKGCLLAVAAFAVLSLAKDAFGANPYLPLWEFISSVYPVRGMREGGGLW